MNFELGKSYIVDVTEKGIIPLSEFDSSKWYDKDHDDLDFLTDEEKIAVINEALNDVKKLIFNEYTKFRNRDIKWDERACGLGTALEIIEDYVAERSENRKCSE